MNKKILYLLLSIFLFLWLNVFAQTNFDIDETFFLETSINSTDYSPLQFNFGGNDLEWLMFWWDGIIQNTDLTINNVTISCNRQLNWLYLNSVRWNRLRPIDQWTLDILTNSNSFGWYDDMEINGGFFTECSGIWIESENIYGYIRHDYDGIVYEMWAGVDYNFWNNTANGIWSGTLKYTNNIWITASGYLFDKDGGIAKAYSNQTLYWNISFTGANVIYSGGIYVTTGTSIQINISSNKNSNFEISGDMVGIITDNWQANVAKDKNITLTTGIWTKTINFAVSTGSETYYRSIYVLLQDPMDIINPTVSLTYPNNNQVITWWNNITFQWDGNDNVWIDYYNLYLSGAGSQDSWINISNDSLILAPIPNGNYSWYVIATDTSWNTWQSLTRTFVISGTTNWTVLLSPISWANIDVWDLLLSRSGVSTSGYTWQIANNNSFSNIVASGTTNNQMINPANNPNFMEGSYYWRVIDNSNAWISTSWLTNIVAPTGWVDLKVDNFEFNDINDAEISQFYRSNEIEVRWITSNTYISIKLENNIWALFVNWVMIGSQWFVKNWDKVYVELLSSDQYEKTLQTKLVIWVWNNEVNANFKINTKIINLNGFELTYSQKLQAIVLLNSLVEMYKDNTNKLKEFLTTFQTILQDKSDRLADQIEDTDEYGTNELALLKWQKASVDYLYYIIDEYLHQMPHGSTNIYTAPNGKEYKVEFNTNRQAYTSPNFIYPKYFPTWELFTKHIDLNNSWNYHGSNNSNNTDWGKITAANSKTYYIYLTNGKRTSDEMSYKRYFDSRDQIIEYIEINNPSATRNHKLDTSFVPVQVTAPNGRKYSVFKTSSTWANANMYSSFGFVTPKYFKSLQAAKDHIVNYNK